MGVVGMPRHPLQAFGVVSLILGGPLSFYSRWLGIAAGAAGIVVSGSAVVRFCRTRSAKSAATTRALAACFFLGSAVALTAGRVSADILIDHGPLPLPSRYATPALAFWAVLFPVSLTFWSSGRFGRLAAMSVSLLVLTFTLGTSNWQWMLSRDWALISEFYDALGCGPIVGASDQQYMSRIIVDPQYRNQVAGYMRQEHLSVFAEPRAGWVNQKGVATLERRSRRGRGVAGPVRCGNPSRHRSLLRDR